jgi:hypothetical protein
VGSRYLDSLRRGDRAMSNFLRKFAWPAYIMWLLPAVLGALLDWSGLLVLSLCVPGLAWYAVTAGRRCYEEVRSSKPEAPVGQRMPMLYILPLLIPTLWFMSRFAGLVVVGGFVYVDLWVWFHRTRTSTADKSAARI